MKMKEFRIGTASKAEFLIRFYSSGWSTFWKTVRYGDYSFGLRHYRGYNTRCYCPVGFSGTVRVVIAGYGFTAWWTRFTGSIPCECDKIAAEVLEAL